MVCLHMTTGMVVSDDLLALVRLHEMVEGPSPLEGETCFEHAHLVRLSFTAFVIAALGSLFSPTAHGFNRSELAFHNGNRTWQSL